MVKDITQEVEVCDAEKKAGKLMQFLTKIMTTVRPLKTPWLDFRPYVLEVPYKLWHVFTVPLSPGSVLEAGAAADADLRQHAPVR